MAVWTLLAGLLTLRAGAWDYEFHRLVNELALAALPTNFPAFVREPAHAERIAFLAGEPDRWRNTTELPLKHVNSPDHYLDLEDLEPLGLNPTNVSIFRHEYTAQIALARAAKPDRFPAVDPAADAERTKWLPGFLPWRITEDHARLKSAFSYLKTYEQHGGTADEIANARANAVHFMGVMGHFVGDAAQPLHTTRHYNGWVGENPKGYTTKRTFHGWIDGGYLRKTGVARENLLARVKPAQPVWARLPGGSREEVFPLAMNFVVGQFPLVETLYEMDLDGRLSGEDQRGLEGRAVLETQLVLAGQFLGELWLAAWTGAPTDNYLRSQLARRSLTPETAK